MTLKLILRRKKAFARPCHWNCIDLCKEIFVAYLCFYTIIKFWLRWAPLGCWSCLILLKYVEAYLCLTQFTARESTFMSLSSMFRHYVLVPDRFFYKTPQSRVYLLNRNHIIMSHYYSAVTITSYVCIIKHWSANLLSWDDLQPFLVSISPSSQRPQYPVNYRLIILLIFHTQVRWKELVPWETENN